MDKSNSSSEQHNTNDIKGKIIKLYGDEVVYPMSAIKDEDIFRYFLDKYAKDIDTIIETGTYMGISAVLLSQYAKTVHTFDVREYPQKNEIWKVFRVNNTIFHLINNDDEKSKILKEIKYQFAFIDGMHIEGVKKDYELLKSCKKLLFHDYITTSVLNGKGMYDYVYTFIESIRKNAKIIDIKSPFIYLEF